jgi:hypothetical protein
MNPDKAPDTDEISTHFYLICWHIIKKDMVCMV